MPYTHFHDWRRHTHRRRPKGGNHWQEVRRRQRPFRVGAWLLVIGLMACFGVWQAVTHDLLGRGRVVVDQQVEDAKARAQTRAADAQIREAAFLSEVEQEIHDGINAERGRAGGSALRWDDRLGELARAHSDDMTERGYFDHDTPEGLGPTDRLRRAGQRCRRGYRDGIGENIAIEWHDRDAGAVASAAVRSWMDSPGHRRNLLNGGYGTTGIGASYGDWEGRKAIYLTQVFC